MSQLVLLTTGLLNNLFFEQLVQLLGVQLSDVQLIRRPVVEKTSCPEYKGDGQLDNWSFGQLVFMTTGLLDNYTLYNWSSN